MFKIVDVCDKKNCEFGLFNSMYIEEVKAMAEFLPRTWKENPVTDDTISKVNELISTAKDSGRIEAQALS